MIINVFGQLIYDPSFLQTDWPLCRVEVLHIRQLVLLLIFFEYAGKSAMFLQKFFLRVREFAPLQVVHDVEVFGRVVLQIHFVNGAIIWLGVVDDVPPMIIVCEHIFCWIHKYFNLVAHFDLQTDQRHIQLVVEDHAHLLELQTNENLVFKGDAIKFILDTGQIVELPLSDLFEVAHSTSLRLYVCANRGLRGSIIAH